MYNKQNIINQRASKSKNQIVCQRLGSRDNGGELEAQELLEVKDEHSYSQEVNDSVNDSQCSFYNDLKSLS